MTEKDKYLQAVSAFQKVEYAFPFQVEFHDKESETIHRYNTTGMTLTDYFAAQYMAAGKLPDEAFRLARIAMKEREAGV